MDASWFSDLIVIFGAVLMLWAILELITSLVFRKQISDMIHATLTSVQTSISVNTQYLTDSLIKLAQLGHAERLEQLKITSLTTTETFNTLRMSIALDQIGDIVKKLQQTGGNGG